MSTFYRLLPCYLLGAALLLSACSHNKTKPIQPSSALLTQQQVIDWADDIDFYLTELEQRHINLYHTVTKAEFKQALTELKLSLPELNHHQVMVAMMGITRLIGDGHSLFGYWEQPYSRYPVYLQLFDSELRVIKTSNEYKYLLGQRLVSIDGKPVEHVIRAVKPVTQGVDNQHSLNHFLPWTINVAEVLYGLNITQQLNQAQFEFANDKGTVSEQTLKSVPSYRLESTVSLGFTPQKKPWQLEESTDGITLKINENLSTAYIEFSGYPGWLKMMLFSRAAKSTLEDAQINNLIIDFRQNGGGNFFEGLLLAQSLITIDRLHWHDSIYVLIGNGTFSAGVSNAAQFKQMLNAKVVGMPSGGNPYGYQDADSILLPRSGWTVQYSKRFFKMQNEFTHGLIPDVKVEQNWRDYQQGIDTQLNWVLTDLASKQSQNISEYKTPSRASD